jgi:putative phosphotransacetylase
MKKEVLVEVSARHVHLSREHVDILFGEGYELTPDKWLSQPGQYSCKERVNIIERREPLITLPY